MSTPLFVELCAGTAALSLRLQARHARPPFGRPGSKLGYADALLELMGLQPGLGADAFLWCEPEPSCALMLAAYSRPGLMQAAAEEARAWIGEDPRELWYRLRAEGDVQGVTAREVARWSYLMRGSYRGRGPDQGMGAPQGKVSGGPGRRNCVNPQPLTVTLPARLESVPLCAATVEPDARLIQPRAPLGTVVYIDPSYDGTKKYRHNITRAEVVDLAVRWQEAGAAVYLSEAVPIEELAALGWHAIEITSTYRGSVRSFSKQQREWLTCSHPPAWTPDVQIGMFG